MKPIRNSASLLVASLSAITLAACGGGGSGGGGGTTTSGISGTGVAQGSVQRFGSIYVNGREFKTKDAKFVIDGQKASQKDLIVGDIVTIKAKFKPNGTAVAKKVFFDAELEGPVKSTDAANNRFVVAGQTVLVSGTTVFAVDDAVTNTTTDFSFAKLQKDQVVEISGRIDGNGMLHASSVELQATKAGKTVDVEVKGKVDKVDQATSIFWINDLKVKYGSLQVHTDDDSATSPTKPVEMGQVLEVTGTLSNGVLDAARLELEDDGLAVEQGDAVEIESFVQSVNKSASTFTLTNGLKVSYGSNTVFEDGASAAEITTGSAIEVEGEVNAQGVLEAIKIELEGAENDPDIEVASRIKSVDNGEITLKVGGIVIDTTGETRLQISEELVNKRDNFTVADLQQGDYVEISAYNKAKNGQTKLVASLIELTQVEQTDTGYVEVSLQAHLASADKTSGMLTILDTRIDLGGGAVEFKNADEQKISQAEFFNQIRKGDLVEVSGTWSGSVIQASEVSVEGDAANSGAPQP